MYVFSVLELNPLHGESIMLIGGNLIQQIYPDESLNQEFAVSSLEGLIEQVAQRFESYRKKYTIGATLLVDTTLCIKWIKRKYAEPSQIIYGTLCTSCTLVIRGDQQYTFVATRISNHSDVRCGDFIDTEDFLIALHLCLQSVERSGLILRACGMKLINQSKRMFLGFSV